LPKGSPVTINARRKTRKRMDPIKYIFEKPSLSGRIAKWQVLLSEYDIVYATRKAIRGSAIADYLANQKKREENRIILLNSSTIFFSVPSNYSLLKLFTSRRDNTNYGSVSGSLSPENFLTLEDLFLFLLRADMYTIIKGVFLRVQKVNLCLLSILFEYVVNSFKLLSFVSQTKYTNYKSTTAASTQ
jgi:hypothetical protein